MVRLPMSNFPTSLAANVKAQCIPVDFEIIAVWWGTVLICLGLWTVRQVEHPSHRTPSRIPTDVHSELGLRRPCPRLVLPLTTATRRRL